MYPNEHGFHFYNSENDGYRGGFGAYSDPVPTTGGPVPPPKKKRGAVRAAALILACAVAGGAAGVGGAAAYQHLNAAPAVIYQSPTPQSTDQANNHSGHPLTPEQR